MSPRAFRTIAVVPCRAGSKGLPGKNTKPFAGKPLFLWAAETGLDACGRVVITTNDERVIGLASVRFVKELKSGTVKLLRRPDALCADVMPMLPVLQHATEALDRVDAVALLQPTSPLRTVAMVRAAIDILRDDRGADSIVSIVETPARYAPEFALTLRSDGTIAPRFAQSMGLLIGRRQGALPAYIRDGSIYLTRAGTLRAGSIYGETCVPLVVPPGQSANIDDSDDWARAESIMNFRIQIRSMSFVPRAKQPDATLTREV